MAWLLGARVCAEPSHNVELEGLIGGEILPACGHRSGIKETGMDQVWV
jgi:hypothetical protein